MPPTLSPTLSVLALLLASQPTNAAPAPQTQNEIHKRECNPDPCTGIPLFSGWVPYCHQGALYCTVSGMVTVPRGRCEEWCQPEPPRPKCPPPNPPQAADCKPEPCSALTTFAGWQPYCYQGALMCTVSGMVTVSVGKCEEWCQPEPERPKGCVEG